MHAIKQAGGWMKTLSCAISLGLVGIGVAWGHDAGSGPGHSHGALTPVALPMRVEAKGPVKAPPPEPSAGLSVSGQGFWRFTGVKEGVLPLPEATRPFLKGAHGTLIWDRPRDVVYWGLEQVGWVAFSDGLQRSWVVKGDPAFAKGNLHGADLWPRKGKLPLVAVADNVDGEVYLSDTTFAQAQRLDWPKAGPYQSKGEFHPTDTAFTSANEVYVTDGYGKAYFMPATVAPLAYAGEYHGGKTVSQTPHGITRDPKHGQLWVSARPEGQVKRWSPKTREWLEIAGLPAGSTVCDVDLWGDYALAPCLNGPEGSPGPIYILNLKKKAIVSVIRPKAELGFTEAQHIHDAMWYLRSEGRKREVFIVFTHWNPGGIGVLRLVNPEGSAGGEGQ